MLGNLREVATGSDVITYRVDGLGRRIAKIKNGVEVKRWTYATALTPTSELDVQSGRMKTFVYASRGNVPDLMTVREGATVTTYRFATDHLGSVRMVVNASCPQTVLPQDVYASCVVWHADFDEYGRRTLIKGSDELHSFGFAGGLFDYETGLTRFGARDYDAQLGRWTARDPIVFAGGQGNLFVYVHDDPINEIDPSGTIEFAFGTTIGGTFGVGRPIQNGGFNFQFATNNESGIYEVRPHDVQDSVGAAASGGISVNVAFGEEGATWDGPFNNLMLGPVTFFWTSGNGPKYFGVDGTIPPAGVGTGYAFFKNTYVPKYDAEIVARSSWMKRLFGWLGGDDPCQE